MDASRDYVTEEVWLFISGLNPSNFMEFAVSVLFSVSMQVMRLKKVDSFKGHFCPLL